MMAERGKEQRTRPESGPRGRRAVPLADRLGRQTLRYPPWQAAFSEEALQRAWLPVRANRGRAAGSESVADFERALAANLDQLRQALLAESYRPHPVKEILVPKGGDGWRPITLWTVADRVVQRAVYDYLAPVWDSRFFDCSYGFRQNRGVHDVAQAIEHARQAGAAWVLDADIEDCFGSMKQKRILGLLKEWRVPEPMIRLIDGWLHAKVANAWRGRDVAGASQGGVITPLLCNLYLHSFDGAMQRPPGRRPGGPLSGGRHRNWVLVRYADDFVVLTQAESEARAAFKHAGHTLRQIGLALNQDKSRLTTFDEGFAFVGWFFVGDKQYQLK